MQYPLDEEIRSAFQGATTSEQGLAQAHGILTQRLDAALARHGDALIKAAGASDRYSGRLVWATLALVLAAIAQVIAVLWRG